MKRKNSEYRARRNVSRGSGPGSYEQLIAEGKRKGRGPEDLLTDDETDYFSRQLELPLCAPSAEVGANPSLPRAKVGNKITDRIDGPKNQRDDAHDV